MKEVLIKIRLEGNRILSAIETDGFDDTIHSNMEIIGILENLKSVELDKLKTKVSINKKIEKAPPTFTIVDDTEGMNAQELLDSVNQDDYPDEEDDPIRL